MTTPNQTNQSKCCNEKIRYRHVYNKGEFKETKPYCEKCMEDCLFDNKNELLEKPKAESSSQPQLSEEQKELLRIYKVFGLADWSDKSFLQIAVHIQKLIQAKDLEAEIKVAEAVRKERARHAKKEFSDEQIAEYIHSTKRCKNCGDDKYMACSKCP